MFFALDVAGRLHFTRGLADWRGGGITCGRFRKGCRLAPRFGVGHRPDLDVRTGTARVRERRRGSLRAAELAPLGMFALGALGAVLAVPASGQAAILALIGGTAESAWILWLKFHLFGREHGLPTWLGISDSSTVGYVNAILGRCDRGLAAPGRGASVPDDSRGGVRLPGAPGDP